MNCYRCATPIPQDGRYCFACGADVSGDTAQGSQPVQRDPELEAKLGEELKGDYVIERLIGRGGMAVVFLARDLQLDRKVAIKVLPPELTFGPGLIERFKREARTAATLDHPHIVPIFRISKGGKLFWFAMKYLAGESLGEVLEREKTLPADRSAAILTQVAEALEFAHEHSIIHRDIKPANVMVDHRGWVTVTDFGIAKAVGLHSLTSSDSIIGTPYYISPEQCSGKTVVTGASDQYSLGVMVYQMLSGHLPFTGTTAVDIIKQQCFDPPPPLDVLQPSLPPGLSNAVERALAKKPEDRFPSVTEFAVAFAAAVQGRPLVLPAGPTPAAPPGPGQHVPARRRSRWKMILGAIAGVAAIGIAGAVLWLQSGTPGVEQHVASGGVKPESTSITPTLQRDSVAIQQPAPPPSPPTSPPVTGAALETIEALKPASAPPPPMLHDGRAPAVVSGGENGEAGPCDRYGPAYNQDNACFDTRPVPLAQTRIPVPADAPIFPRDAVLLFHVSRAGETIEARLFTRSNVETFNDQALDVAKSLRWNPAQQNGEPVDAWVQWLFKATRQ